MQLGQNVPKADLNDELKLESVAFYKSQDPWYNIPELHHDFNSSKDMELD